MKTLILSAIVSMGLMSSAMASHMRPVMSCNLAVSAGRYQMNVTIVDVTGPARIGGAASYTQAVVTEGMGNRNHVLATYSVEREQGSAMGAPLVYKTQDGDFYLNVSVGTTPVDGGVRSHLEAITSEGQKLSDDMVCRFSSL
jgi:hypothetical protein